MRIRRKTGYAKSRISAKAGVRLFLLFDPEAVPGASPNGIGHVFTSYWARRLGTSASGRASGRKGAKCLNEKTYKSERELRSAVDRYFAAICYREPVTRMVPVLEDREFIKNGERIVMQCPALDKYGHQQMAVETVMRGKKPLMREVWTRPPCLPEMLAALGVDEKRWAQMCASEELGKACARAGARIEIYNIQRLDSSNANGAKFHLERRFGWDEAKDGGVEVAFELPEGVAGWEK